MRKIYRMTIVVIALIGACVMGFQHDYLVALILLGMAGIFFINRNQVNDKDE